MGDIRRFGRMDRGYFTGVIAEKRQRGIAQAVNMTESLPETAKGEIQDYWQLNVRQEQVQGLRSYEDFIENLEQTAPVVFAK